jgi:hypothetical protein
MDEPKVYHDLTKVERTLRVRGDLHIGGVMIRLVDELGKSREQFLFFLIIYKLWWWSSLRHCSKKM